MRKFSYKARDNATGKIIKSTVQADTENSAAQLLIEQGYAPLDIKEDNSDDSFLKKISGRITTKDKVIFTRQLSTLLGAGLPLAQSLVTAYEQTENKKLKSIVQSVVTSVESGRSLADSFAKYPEVFDKVFIALVAAGELSGSLDDALKRIAIQQEKDAAMMSKIRGALMYPLIVLVVITGVMAFLLFTVVPQIKTLYKDMNKELPFISQVMVGAADFAVNYWWLMIIIIGICGYFFVQYLKTDIGIKTKDTFKLNVPLFKNMFRKLYMARFMRTGQTLLSTGVPMLDMLRISADSVNNVNVAGAIKRATEKVKGGKALSSSLKNEDYILLLVPQMIKIGEQSGKIDDMMGKVAQVYEDELDEEIKAISTAIEPVMMVLLAIVAGGAVAAILLPIYSLVGDVNM